MLVKKAYLVCLPY